jgi:lipoprotein-anchoring transpeptidase ErfK/SrfK
MPVTKRRVNMAGGRHCCIVFLSAAAAVALTSQAGAAIYYWPDSDPGLWRPAPPTLQHHQRVRRKPGKKTEIAEKETAKPQGPLIISISIAQQKVRIYDANGLFAEAPVSTGMPGHPTPMGVFSVIQKHRLHHSNIYSGAPMPYMQRITWSGVAMHAGVLPGHPASHGCIRMPTAFAIKMWNWTKMGARVVITPGDVTPTRFSHPLLATLKVQPQSAATEEPKQNVAAPANTLYRKTEADTNAKAVVVEASVEERSTIGRDGSAGPPTDQPPDSAAPQRRTADAASTSAVTNRPTGEKQKSAEDIKAVPSAPAIAAEPKLEQTQPADVVKAAISKIDPSKHAGPISMFVSRKDSKLYVRQNFAPLFDVPITILPGDRPLGTHVFTVQIDKDDTNVLHWSVVSLPPQARYADRRGEDERNMRRRKTVGAAFQVKPPEQDSPTQALDRVKLPEEAMARIAEALSTGGSIIVSDQGIAAGETGEGTDFIVTLR